MELEVMAQQVKTDNSSAYACPGRQEKINSKPRGSGSPFKCIGIGFVQQMNSEKDEELSAAKQRIVELEGIAASRQREVRLLLAFLFFIYFLLFCQPIFIILFEDIHVEREISNNREHDA
jgi:kinesin family protein 15